MLTQSSLHEKVDFRIAVSAIGPNGQLTPASLIRLLQEAAMVNTVRLGISSPELMASHGLSWILRRQRVNIDRLPQMGEKISIITAPSGFERSLQTFRDFHLIDEAGHRVASAATQWLLMDVQSRRLKAIPAHIAALKSHLAPAAAHLDRPLGKIKAPELPGKSRAFTVAYHQLDFNNHLTNSVFPELMLEPLGEAFLASHLPTLLDIDFRMEARYGEELRAESESMTSNGLLQRHALRRDGELLATMESCWKAN